LFPAPAATAAIQRLRDAFKVVAHAAPDGEISLLPMSARGKLGLSLMAMGFALFLGAVLSGSVSFAYADAAAVAGMLVFFAGGLTRIYSE
jgi:hypothetical protein